MVPKEAAEIVEEVRAAIGGWRKVATRCGISPSEQNRLAMRLDNNPSD